MSVKSLDRLIVKRHRCYGVGTRYILADDRDLAGVVTRRGLDSDGCRSQAALKLLIGVCSFRSIHEIVSCFRSGLLLI